MIITVYLLASGRMAGFNIVLGSAGLYIKQVVLYYSGRVSYGMVLRFFREIIVDFSIFAKNSSAIPIGGANFRVYY